MEIEINNQVFENSNWVDSEHTYNSFYQFKLGGTPFLQLLINPHYNHEKRVWAHGWRIMTTGLQSISECGGFETPLQAKEDGMKNLAMLVKAMNDSLFVNTVVK